MKIPTNRKLLPALIASLTLGASFEAFATPVAVDLFAAADQQGVTDDGPVGSPPVPATGYVIDPTGNRILGGERDVSALKVTAANDLSASKWIITNGAANFSNDTGVGGIGTIQWDGLDASMTLNPTGLGGIDMTAFGNAFTTSTDSDLAFNIVIGLWTDADSYTITTIARAPGPHVADILFADVMNPGLCGLSFGPIVSVVCGPGNSTVDMTNLGAIEFIVNPGAATIDVDLSVSQITTVPEPGSLALLATSLIGLGLARRRRLPESARI